MEAPEKTAAIQKGMRIYEYRTQDGRIFWSFDKFPNLVTHSQTLTLVDRVGTHFDNYLAEIRALRQVLRAEKGK